MRLSVVFELLLVFLFLAFAAARVIDPKSTTKNVIKGAKKQVVVRQGPPNRYCACTSKMCNCCRDFSLPVVPLKGPGCASLLYVQKNTMLVTMSFGDRVLSNTTISGKNPQPICMPLPGGISQFCGRVYGISRKGDQFRACLGLELRALDDIEAALRISCFKFGPKGVNLEAAPPVPTGSSNNKKPAEDDDDDDDDDYLDDDDDDDIIGFGVDDDEGSSEDNEVDSDSVDYTGFSVLGEDILGSFFSDDSGSSGVKKKKVKKTTKPQVILQKAPTTTTTTTTRRPFLQTRWRPAIPSFVTRRPIIRRPTTTAFMSSTKPSKPSTVTFTTESEYSATMPPAQVTPTLLNNKVSSNVAQEYATVPTKTIFITSEPSVQSVEKLNGVTIFESTDSMKTEMETATPVTFTVPTKRIEPIKNDITIPNVDLSKIEALAAIAQQDVTSGVFSTSSMTMDETEKPSEEVVTKKYEKIVPTYISHQADKNSQSTETINYVQFVPNVVVTSSTSNTKLPAESILIQRNVTNTHPTTLVTLVSSSKKKVTNNIKATTIKPNHEKEKEEEEKEEDEDDDDDDDEEDEDTLDDTEEESSNEDKKEEKTKNNKKPITATKVTYKTKNKDKGSFKKQPVKGTNKESEEEEEEEEEEEDDDDILSGVLGDDDGEEENEEENEEEEEKEKEKEKEEDSVEKETEPSTTTKRPKKGSEKEKEENESDEEEESEEEPEDDDLDDDEIAEILGETKLNTNKKKPVVVTVSKKPLSDNKEKVSEDEDDDDDDDEDDVLAALDDDTEDDDDEKIEKNKTKNKNKTKTKKPVKSSTVKVKIASQSVTPSLLKGQPTAQTPVHISGNKQSNTQQIIHTTKIKKKPSIQTQQIVQSSVQSPVHQQIIHTIQRIPANQQKIQTTEIRNSTNYITHILQSEPSEIQGSIQNVIWKTPIPQEIIQKLITRKPVDTTETAEVMTNAAAQTVPEKLEMPGETTEKVFTFEPITQKVFLYSRPENQVPQKISGVTFFQKPIAQQYVIYNEPVSKTTEVPVTFIYPPQESSTKAEGTTQKEKENESDDSHSHSSESSSSEEHAEAGHNTDKHTFTASIDPGFSNKYGEEHDLPENEDLGIEDSDDDDEEEDVDDRKLKQISKTAVVKSASNKKPSGVFNDPKWMRLSSAGIQPKKFLNLPRDNKPISTSRTHRRMNLDRFLGN